MREESIEEAIRTEGLGHDYGERRALDQLDLTIAAGATFALLGPNGGGKTTLFRILATLLRPSRGRAALFGIDVVRQPAAARRALGVVFQAPAVDRLLSVRENLEVQAHLYGLGAAARRQAIGEAIERLGLQGRERDRVGTLSGGLARRVEIAKVLLHQPRLLLLDEPSTGLDPAARASLWEALRQRAARQRVTVVFTTHLLDEAERADQVAILHAGRLVALGPPERLRAEIGGQVVVLAPRPEIAADAAAVTALRREVDRLSGLESRLVDGTLRLESDRAPHVVELLIEGLPDRFDSVTLARPTLLDVFVRRTGRRFDADGAATATAGRGAAA